MTSKIKYDHKNIEAKWQNRWEESKIYSPDIQKAQNPFYNLFMFPYPSAEGLHAGHAMSSTGSDIYGRFQRMNGKNVLQPMGYDSFGIHSENYALKIGESPQVMLNRSIKHFEEQFKSFGHGYDWTHTVTTSDVNYYHWTEWVFKELFKAGLAYRKKALVNFCPKDKTVLSDEQVMTPKQAGKDPIDAKGNPVANTEGLMVCERCGTVVEKKELEVWFFRITDYAERLLENLPKINWSERVIVAQREWIGKKEGIEIDFKIINHNEKITVFTTTPINFGATFLVVAPEYARDNLLEIIPESNKEDVKKYIKRSLSKTKQQREAEGKDKTGVFTGLYVENHLTKKQIPVWVTDFVLMDFGTGAVQGCPGHDKRDFEFAKKFGLPITRVVEGKNGEAGEIKEVEQLHAGEEAGKMINSDFLNGIEFTKAMEKTKNYFEEKGWGKRVFTYHLRDWGIGRQRYWGCPLPMIFCEECAKKGDGYLKTNNNLLHQNQSDWDWQGWWPEENLPVKLPVIEDYKPEGNGRGPLANHPEFYEVKCPHCGSNAKRETDVADTFLDSSWYFLRYPSTNFDKVPFDKEITKKWLPVNQYFGGAEHAVLHLMYARFVTMVLHDLDYLNFEEPFPNFFAHGLMIKDGAKMSKSRGNVVNPDEYIKKFGADTLRMYVVFIGPMDGSPDFRDTGIEGMQKFIRRVWNLYFENKKPKDEKKLQSKLHQTIQKVTKDIEIFHYNTAIATIMEFVNYLYDNGTSKESLIALCQLLAPFAPHVTEELWNEVLQEKYSVHNSNWPKYNSKYIKVDQLTIIVQVNGKFRSQVQVETSEGKDKKKITALALKDEKVEKWISGKDYKVIFVAGKIINFVVSI
ncbi:MAG TPA: class I tRNA ligase family protein [Patescibacteria group bacterium]|nr:class I tRNA ligase family protein [Patescibacteria group bacterium]